VIVEGTHTIDGIPPEIVFDALADPAVLARALPGCRNLVDRGDGQYKITIDAGVGAVRGEYAGEMTIGEARRPELYEATLTATGGPGGVQATLRAELADTAAGTDVRGHMDAKVTGRIAGVGQRVITGVSRRNASEFFKALAQQLAEHPEEAQPEPAPADAPHTEPAPDDPQRVYDGRPHEHPTPVGLIVGVAMALGLVAPILVRIVRRTQR
jgi:carbon monoxide dehydrogenase subunit G